MTVATRFPPLQGAISQAELWTHYLDARGDEIGHRPPKEIGVALKNIVGFGVSVGELLPFTWGLIFCDLIRSGEPTWTTVAEFEAARQEVRRLFYITREAMERTRHVAETLQSRSGRKRVGMARLLKAIARVAALEEAVFRDWPSFAEPLPKSANALAVDESLAEALNISVDEARRRMDVRRRNSTPNRSEGVEYKIRLDALVRRQMIRWKLPDSLLVDVHLRLSDELPSSPTTFLQSDPSWFGGDGMVYGFDLVEPDNRMLVHAFRFQVVYHADEQTLLVVRGRMWLPRGCNGVPCGRAFLRLYAEMLFR